ncbi:MULTISPECIES: hypothetical protein [Pseudomonas]|uniref:hypothetical protein n=1 Tax=Pseudomonas TaxID=286 RepID=UPI0012F8B7DC|nr:MULTISPECIES: hypothetical protein [Pseudomonas]ELS0927494.1 hypothetical protein [Pseudomonas putida]MBH3348889.1 hypothetical protein [Pseudomonas putida]UWH21061.1 hypothetical protein KW568_18755 [Pseudomonas sp. HD6515]HDS0942088.1 hypothetical protein [Pseudomonas putida]
MKILKSLARKPRQEMHSNEDARVTQVASSQLPPPSKWERLKSLVARLTKMLRRIPYYVWLWEKGVQGYEFLKEHVVSLLEEI